MSRAGISDSSSDTLQGMPLALSSSLPIARPCEFMESCREKQLKPYPMGYDGRARQMIQFQRSRESGFGLVGRIKNLRGLSGMSIHLSKSWL